MSKIQFPSVRLRLLDPLLCPYCRGWGYRFRRQPTLEKYTCDGCVGRGMILDDVEFSVHAETYVSPANRVYVETVIVNPWKLDAHKIIPGFSEVPAYGPRSLEACALRCVAERVWSGCGFETQGNTLFEALKVVAPYQWPDGWKRLSAVPGHRESPVELELARRDGVYRVDRG